MASAKTLEEGVVHILWMQGGLSCDGDSEPDLDAIETENGLAEAGIVDAHGMDPASVLALLRSIGGHVDRLLLVGIDEGMGLSEGAFRPRSPPQKGDPRMIRRLFTSAVLLVAAVAVVQSLPDIARDLKLRDM